MKTLCIALVYFLLAAELKYVFDALQGSMLFTVEKKETITAQIRWDSSSLQQISPAGVAAFYPRMLQLPQGGLLVAYASKGNILIQQSRDGGRQWQLPQIAANWEEGINMDTPELLQLANGNILLLYNGRPQAALKGMPDTGKVFDIRIKKSVDNGISWQHESVLYKGGASFKNGCWEPAALQLPSGEIQLFFSDESIYTSSGEQNISLLRSADNGMTWSPKPQIISFRKNSRDGMPSPIWLPDQQTIAIAIEDPGYRNFKPYIIRSSPGGQWRLPLSGDDPQRQYALADKLPDSIYAGAPCLRRLSTGITVLSYQSTEGRKGKNSEANAVMVVATGNAQAAGFDNITFPFKVPEGYHALWNALCITKGDTIIAVSSTNAYSKQAPAIWMIKGVLQKG